jgi:hypothetical protein
MESGVERQVFVCRKQPFKEKHVMQQDSILGNLEQSRVFKDDAGK